MKSWTNKVLFFSCNFKIFIWRPPVQLFSYAYRKYVGRSIGEPRNKKVGGRRSTEYDWNDLDIVIVIGLSFGGEMTMMTMTINILLSRNIDIQECTTYAIGAVEVKTGAILHE